MSKYSLNILIGILFSVICVSWLSAEETLPQAVKDLQKAALEYIAQDDIPQAVVCYQSIIQTEPNASYAVNAQRRIVTVYEQDDQLARAKTSLSEMKQKYLSHSAYVKEAHEVGWEFVKKGDYTTALTLYKDLQTQFPNHERAAWFQRSIVQTYLEKGDLDNVKQSVEDLKANFKAHPDYVNQMKVVADRLRSRKQYQTAAGIYDQLLKNDPNNTQAVVWQRLKIQNALDMKQKEIAKSGVETLFSSYKNTSEFVKQAHEIGWKFVETGDIATGLRIYKGLQEQFPNHERAVWFQRSIAQTYLEQGNMNEALKAVNKLKTDFQSHPDYINQMEKMVGILVDKNQPKAAEDLCKTLITKFPDHSKMPWFLHYKARSQIWMSDPNAVEAADATVAVLQNYSSDPNYAETMSWTAYNYRTSGHYQRAIELFNTLLAQNPGPKIQLRSVAGIAQSYARLGEDEKAKEKVTYMLSNFEDNPSGVAFYVFGVGEEYFLMAQEAGKDGDPNTVMASYQKAIDVWRQFQQAMPKSDDNSRYAYFSGIASQRLGQYENAIGYYQQVAERWPTYEKTWHARYMAMECLDALVASGQVDSEVAVPIKQAFYEEILQKNFDCPVVNFVRQALNSQAR